MNGNNEKLKENEEKENDSESLVYYNNNEINNNEAIKSQHMHDQTKIINNNNNIIIKNVIKVTNENINNKNMNGNNEKNLNHTEGKKNDIESLIDNNNEQIKPISEKNDLIDTGNNGKINNDNKAKFQCLFTLLGRSDYDKYLVDENNKMRKLGADDSKQFKNTVVKQLRTRLNNLATAYKDENENWQTFGKKLNNEKKILGKHR